MLNPAERERKNNDVMKIFVERENMLFVRESMRVKSTAICFFNVKKRWNITELDVLLSYWISFRFYILLKQD